MCMTAYHSAHPDETQNQRTCRGMDRRRSCEESATSCPRCSDRAEPVSQRRMRTETRRTPLRSRTAQSSTVYINPGMHDSILKYEIFVYFIKEIFEKFQIRFCNFL